MTITEKIQAYISQNSSRQITGANLREILLDLAAEVEAVAEPKQQFTISFPNSDSWEEDITHTLDANYVTVDIWLTTGEKIPYSSYRVFTIDSATVKIAKDVLGVWTNAKVILTKKDI